MSRQRDSTRARRICYETHRRQNAMGQWVLDCHRCKSEIDLLKFSAAWRADHIKPWAIGGEDTPENLWPICLACDSGVGGKAAADTTSIAKGKRLRSRQAGIKRRKSRPLPGTKDSGWRHKINGTWERR